MALTLQSTTVTKGADFSSTVSGFTAASDRSLGDNEFGIFQLAQGPTDTTMNLVAKGYDLGALPSGLITIAIDERPSGAVTATRTYFNLNLVPAQTSQAVSVSVTQLPTLAVGDTVNVAAPTTTGLTSPMTFSLIDAVSGVPRKPPAGLTFNNAGLLTGKTTNAYGAYGLSVLVQDANGKRARSPSFSIDVLTGIKPSNNPITGGGGGLPQIVGGVAIGSLGTGIYSDFSLVWGNDYDAIPAAYDITTKSGKATPGRMQGPARRGASSGSLTHEVIMNTVYRGSRSQYPTPLGIDPASSASASILRMTPVPTVGTSGYSALQTNYNVMGAPDGFNKPSLYSSGYYHWPEVMFSQQGDFIFEGKFKPDAGAAHGMQAALWTSGASWPDFGEIDLWELRKDASNNTVARTSLHESTVDGGADQNILMATTPTLPTGRYTTMACVKQDNTLTVYDDIASEGTLVARTTYTNALVGRLKGSADIRLTMYVSNTWDSSTYNEADWSNKGISVDWSRLWLPTGTGDLTPIVDLGTIQTTPGGSWGATIPADSVLYSGQAPDVTEIHGVYAEEDSPGYPTKAGYASPPGPGLSHTPGGMTVSGKSITGTVPTTEGGRIGVMFIGTFNAGGPAVRSMLYYDVAPAVQALWDNLPVGAGQTATFQIPYWAFHSGNLGHTYTSVTSDKAWAVPSIASDKQSASIAVSGAQAAGDVATITISATNGSGQTTTVTRTITAQAKAIYVYESFTPTSGDVEDIKAHSPEIGGSWVNATYYSAEANGGRLDIRGYFYGLSPGNNTYYNNVAPPSADYFVEAKFRTDSVLTSPNDTIAVAGRMSNTANTMYKVGYNPSTGNIELGKIVAGTQTVLGSFAYTPTVGGTETLRLIMIGTSISASLNGTQIIAPVTDSAVTAAGFGGIRSVTAQSSATGRHPTSFTMGAN